MSDAGILTVDIGGSSLRAGMVDRSGRLGALVSIPLTHRLDADGTAETSPRQWWAAMLAAVEALDPEEAAAIAITGITRSQVLVGADGQPVRSALLWHDSRADATLAGLLARLPVDHPERAGLNAFHPLARLWWLADREPEALAATVAVVDPKDWLNARLTGVVASDTVSLSRLSMTRDLAAAAGLPDLLPPLGNPVEVLAPVRAGLPGALGRLAGVPVIRMATDTWAAALGLGAMRAGGCYSLSGTTEVLGVVSDQPLAADGLLSLDWAHGLWHLGGPMQAGADCLVWLLDLLGKRGPVGPILDGLLAGARDPSPVLFLPHLTGARVPFWDSTRRGSFLGLNRRHGAPDIAWAVLEGIACLNRLVLDRAEAARGQSVEAVRFGGGGASSEHWTAIKADVLGRPVERVATPEPGLAGAAIAASVALGTHGDLAAAQHAMVTVAERILPDPTRRADAEALVSRYRVAEDALSALSAVLATPLPAWTAAR
ncbi:MAG: carbohydrate kinase [Alphaproteobacteria bacterium]|nr:MAG: carbohydrate kinase [Alphaproteobacteria bacterium]